MKHRQAAEAIVSEYIATSTDAKFNSLKPCLNDISAWPDDQFTNIFEAVAKDALTKENVRAAFSKQSFKKKENFSYDRYSPAQKKRADYFNKSVNK